MLGPSAGMLGRVFGGGPMGMANAFGRRRRPPIGAAPARGGMGGNVNTFANKAPLPPRTSAASGGPVSKIALPSGGGPVLKPGGEITDQRVRTRLPGRMASY